MEDINDLKMQIEALKKEVSNSKNQIKNLEADKLILSQKVSQSHNHTLLLANASPNSIIQLTKEFNILFINNTARILMNIKDDNFYGKHIKKYVPPEVYNDIENKVEAAFITNKKVESIFHYQTKYFRVVANVTNSKPEKSVLIITTEITEEVNYETELKFKSVLLQKVYDESENSLLVLEAESKQIISCNKTTYKMFDLNKNMDFDFIRNYIFSSNVNPTGYDADNAFAKAGIFVEETEFTSFTGRQFLASYQISLFEIDGKKLFFCKIADITKTREANRKLLIDSQKQKLHMEQSPLGYLEWNANFEVAEWNPSAEKIFGFTRDEAIGKHATFIIQESEKEFSDEYWNILISSSKGSRSKQYNINKKNELIFVEWYNTPLFDEKGKLLGISCLVDNITDKLKAEEELKQKSEILETIYEEAFDSIMLFKPDSFEVIECNKRSFEIFEVENLEQLNILMPTARKKKQTRQERIEAYETIAQNEIIDKDIEFITSKGNSVWLTMYVKLIIFNNQTVELVRLTDVSIIKKINKELNIDKQKQRIQIQESPIGYIEWNNKFKVAEWNPIAEKIFGYSKSEALGKSAQFILPTWEKNNTAKIWQTMLAYKGGRKGIHNNLNKSDEVLTVEWYDTPLFDEEGNVLGVSSLVIDITDKIKKEEELRYKTAFLETIYEEAFDAIMLFKPNTFEVITCNKRTFEIFETENIDQLNSYMPNARKNILSLDEREKIFSEIQNEHVYDTDIEFVTIKGKTIWLTMFVKLIKLDGEVVELVRITDVSELKKVNSKLNLDRQKQILQVEQSPLAYIEWDLNFKVVEWNSSAEKIFGYTKKEALGKHATFIIPDEVKPQVDDIWKNLQTQKGGYRSTNQNINKNNETLTLEWYNTPLFNDNGNFLGVSSLVDNITEQIKAQKEIEKQLKEKEVMLSEIHHRVKNNLAVISGLLFMHSEHVDDESVKLILKESQSRIKSMAIIHEQLYQTENFGNINVNIYLKELVKKIASTFNNDRKIIDLDIEVSDFSMPISQALIIGLIINELVINSYKYAFDHVEIGKIKIRFEKKGKHILRVSDNGVGYKEDYNFEKSNSLGLNLVKILAKQLKGDVLFENKKGAYCTLIFN